MHAMSRVYLIPRQGSSTKLGKKKKKKRSVLGRGIGGDGWRGSYRFVHITWDMELKRIAYSLS